MRITLLLFIVCVLMACSGHHKAIDHKMAILSNKEDVMWVTGGSNELWSPNESELYNIGRILEEAMVMGSLSF
jgi:hypothetical protein